MMREVRPIIALASLGVAEAIRDRILYGLLAFALGMILLSAVLSNLTLGFGVRIVTDLSLSAISVAGTTIAILLGVGAIAREIERRTALPLLAMPIERWQYVIGRYLGVVATVWLNVVPMMIAASLMIWAFGPSGFPYSLADFVTTLILALCRFALTAAVAVALSSIASSTVSLIASSGVTIAGYLTGELRFFLEKSDDPFTQKIGTAVYYIVPDFSLLDGLSRLLHGDALLTPVTLAAVGYALCYAVVVLSVAIQAFGRRDIA